MQKQIYANKALIMHGKSRQPNAKTMQSKEIKQSNENKKKQQHQLSVGRSRVKMLQGFIYYLCKFERIS